MRRYVRKSSVVRVDVDGKRVQMQTWFGEPFVVVIDPSPDLSGWVGKEIKGPGIPKGTRIVRTVGAELVLSAASTLRPLGWKP